MMCKLYPDYNENIIVATIHNHEFAWYVTDKELWYLDYKKRMNLFKEQGYDLPEEYIDDERQNLLLLDSSNAHIFLERIVGYKVSTQTLRNLLKEAKDMNDDSYLYDFRPSLYVNFDQRFFYSSYTEPASYEDYVPEHWISKFKDFKEIIPDDEKYWIGENLEDHFQQSQRRENILKKTISIISEEFQNEKTGENVEGITIMIDGILKEFLDVIKEKHPEYQNNAQLVQDALMKGLDIIKDKQQ